MGKLACLLASIALTGCVLSIEPVVPESAATVDARLLGNWNEVEGSGQVAISVAGTNGYALAYTDSDGQVGRFEARLGRLGRYLVLDVRPAARDSGRRAPEAGALIRGHVLLTVEFAGDSARIALLQPDSLHAAVVGGALRLSQIANDDQLILTGTTDELWRGLGPYLARPGALDPQGVWRRIAGPGAMAPPPRATASTPPARQPAACFEPSPWRDADLLFHRDPHWLGSDGASSVDLGGGRTLWLFGDTWIDRSGAGTRRSARMVSNTVAIQRGSDPATATIDFYWGRGPDGSPAAYFPDRGEERLWLGNGVRVEDRLVIFLNRIRSTNTGLGFESVGWTAVIVQNPDAEPSAWRVTPLDTPSNSLGVVVGYAAVLRMGDYEYAFGSEDPVKSHPLYAARWPVAAVRRGNLLRPEWWAGARLGWVPDSSGAPRWPLFENGSSDLTLHFDETSRQFIVVQAVGFGPADVTMRTAPELTGGDLVVTYATNTFQFAEHLADGLIYYPRFLRLTRCR